MARQGRRAQTLHEKKAVIAELKARKMNAAVNLWNEELKKLEVERMTQAAIAEKFGVPLSTLSAQIGGRPPADQVAQSRERLNEQETIALIDYIKCHAARGFPPPFSIIYDQATQLLNSQGDLKPLGVNWVYCFLARHPDVKKYTSNPMDRVRGNGLGDSTVPPYFDAVEKVFNEHFPDGKVNPARIFGMDESGIMMGHSGSETVVGKAGLKRATLIQEGNRENVTVLVTICADGTKLKETIIFKGKNVLRKWLKDRPDVRVAVSETGYTNSQIGLTYLMQFDEATRHLHPGIRILFVDGHKSHCSLAFLEYAAENDIVILAYPSHCTHALQGLDVVAFGPLKANFGKLRREWDRERGTQLTKIQFLALYQTAAKRTFTSSLIKSFFRATGIVPFNRNIITPEQMAPAATDSTSGSTALELPSPVKEIMVDLAHAKRMHTDTHVADCEGLSPSAGPLSPLPALALALQVPLSVHHSRLFQRTALTYGAPPSPLTDCRLLPTPIVLRVPLAECPDFKRMAKMPAPTTVQGALEWYQQMQAEWAKAESYATHQERINTYSSAQLILQAVDNDVLHNKRNTEREESAVKKAQKGMKTKLSNTEDAHIWSSEEYLRVLQAEAEEQREKDGVVEDKRQAKVRKQARKATRLEWGAKARADWEAMDADQLAAWAKEVAAHQLLPCQRGRLAPKKPAPPLKPVVPQELLDTDVEGPVTLAIRRGAKKGRGMVAGQPDDEFIAFEGGRLCGGSRNAVEDEEEEVEDKIDG